MFSNNLSKRERYLATATVSIVLIAVVYGLIIRPAAARWKNLSNQIRSRVNTLEKDSAILAGRKIIESEYARLSKYARPAKSEEQAIADTLSFIENVSRNDSCRIVNIKPVGTKDSGYYKEIVIDVNAEADIGQFSKFLYDMENPRDNLINIKDFALSAKSGQPGVLKGTFLISKILLD